MRAGGGTNVFLRMTVDDGSLQSWSNWFEYFHTPGSTVGFKDAFGRGRIPVGTRVLGTAV